MGMNAKKLRSVKAVTYKCGGMKAMDVCSGKDAGVLLSTKVLPGTKNVARCPANSKEEKGVTVGISQALGVKSTLISLVACVPAGSSCEGQNRRMASSSNTINYAVTVAGTASSVA